jgi:cell division protein FtsI (penicillin-binding protein 3)
MGFGYNLTITPMHTAMLYNAIANGGKMMKPYLVNALVKDGQVIKQFEPTVLNEQVCSPDVVSMLKTCMEGVVERGTARGIKSEQYAFAGKTGTALVADKGIRYSDKVYQSSFAGYFPANDPQYTIVVVIRNKAHAAKFYGGSVAGPVFREIADRIYATHLFKKPELEKGKADSLSFNLVAYRSTVQKVGAMFGWRWADSSATQSLVALQQTVQYGKVLRGNDSLPVKMPPLQGVGLKDALTICEERGLRVSARGKGKVMAQSIAPGLPIQKGQTVLLELN